MTQRLSRQREDRYGMAHHESDYEPAGAVEEYNGFKVWDHGVWPVDVSPGEVDGDVTAPDSE